MDDLRAVTADELDAFSRAVGVAFGHQPTEVGLADLRTSTEADRTLAVFEDGTIVATAAALSFRLTLPGGTQTTAAGVTAVGVRPTHRRQGLLTRMMRRQLDDAAGRGEPIAVLTATEGSIYGRFGYGPAAFASWWTLQTEGTTLSHPPATGGRLRMVDLTAARGVIPVLFEAARARHVGAVSRSSGTWDVLFADREWERRGASALFAVVHERDDIPDGFALYRMRAEMTGPGDPHVLSVVDLDALDDDAEAALWQYVIDVDLVTTVSAYRRPVDEPLRWRLTDPRRVRSSYVGDHLWVRVLDVARAFGARGYAVDDALVLEVADAFRPDTAGRWRIDGGPDGASVARSDAAADLALGASELGSILLGGVAPSVLARAGRISEHTPGALRRADAFFVTHPAPWCGTDF